MLTLLSDLSKCKIQVSNKLYEVVIAIKVRAFLLITQRSVQIFWWKSTQEPSGFVSTLEIEEDPYLL